MPKFNLSPNKNPMPVQEPSLRNANFEEVALGYSEETAKNEALRCLNCKNQPCVNGCPVNVRIPKFISLIAEGKFEESYQVIAETSSLPAVCGRVCPQERQCESKCTRGIKGEPVGIGYLERFAADYHNAHRSEAVYERPAPNGHKVAVIGSGPAGLACAGDLAKLGYDVTVFEALHTIGGVLAYGIPEFRLPKAIIQQEADNLRSLGVKFETNMVIGRILTIEELKSDYGFEAIFIGTGAGLPRFMGIPGENSKGVFSANEYLTRINLMKAYRSDSETPVFRANKVVVVGGGNVAMDAARSAKRMGADVHIVYRRSEAELPARKEETEHAKEEGIVFDFLTNPVEILVSEDDSVRGVRCVKMQLGEADASGRRRPVELPDSDFTIDADCVIMALGTSPNPLLIRTTEGLSSKPHGEIVIDEDGKTSIEGVYAGGDAVTGAATVILAMGAGKTAAKSIHELLQKQ